MIPVRLCLPLLALLLLSCTQAPSSGPTIVLVVADGLRADRAAEVAEGALAPWLSGDDVLVFERAYASSSLGEQSLAALFTGRTPTHGGSIGLIEAQPAQEATTLATRLRRMGYSTAFVSQSSWAGRPGFTRGFHDVQVAPADGWPSREVSQRAMQAADDWQSSSSERPLFLVAHWAPPQITLEPQVDLEADYDRQVADVIDSVAELLGKLDERGLLTDALLVFTSSHGFELLEHGGIGAGWNLEEEAVRVPLMLRGSVLGTAGRTIRSPESMTALTGTLLELADPQPTSATQDGDTSDPLPSLSIVTQAEARPVVTELVVRERAIMRAIVLDDFKYLQVLREVPPADREIVQRGYEELQAAMLSGAIATPPLFGDPVREALFLLPERGLGVNELSLAENVETLSRVRALLRDYERLCESEGWIPPQITDRLPIDTSDVEDLETLGYL